ncbi:HAD family hydrolase [Paenibacillus sp. TRM 82003]|nr:HAD family hydrolase [Paenibacillus sp. TRM 82003]
MLFDLDGTLMDSKKFLMDAAYETMEKYRPGSCSMDELSEGFGMLYAEMFRSLGEETGSQAVDDFNQKKRLDYHRTVQPFAGVVEGLRLLRQRGCVLGVVTNQKRDVTRRCLETTGLTACFEVVVGIEDVREGKPHPESILLAMVKLGAKPEETVMIGDTDYDLLAAERAGIRSVLLEPYGTKSPRRGHAVQTFPDFQHFLHAMLTSRGG